MAPGQSSSFCFWVSSLPSTWATTGHVCPRWVRVQSSGRRGYSGPGGSFQPGARALCGSWLVWPPIPGETCCPNPTTTQPRAAARLRFATVLSPNGESVLRLPWFSSSRALPMPAGPFGHRSGTAPYDVDKHSGKGQAEGILRCQGDKHAMLSFSL